MTRQELQAQQRLALYSAQSQDQMRIALQQLHDAAVMRGAGIEADQYRQQLHAVLDAYLDASARYTELTRALIMLP